jgi:hypothetical protein
VRRRQGGAHRQGGARERGGRERRGRNITNRSFSTNQWHWWVISPNSRKLGFGGVPIEALHENHGVGGLLHLFSGVDPRWSWWSWVCLAEKIWSGAVFLDLELRGALPNTPLKPKETRCNAPKTTRSRSSTYSDQFTRSFCSHPFLHNLKGEQQDIFEYL